MSTHIYSRELADGHYNVRVLELAQEAKVAIPGNTFSVKATGTVVTIVATPDLTGGEETTLDTVVSDHKAVEIQWPPLDNVDRDVNEQTGTSYTLIPEDSVSYVRCTNADPIALTVPPNSSVPFLIRTEIPINQGGAGQVTLTEGAGVTINANKKITAQNKGCILIKTGEDTWDAHGSLEA